MRYSETVNAVLRLRFGACYRLPRLSLGVPAPKMNMYLLRYNRVRNPPAGVLAWLRVGLTGSFTELNQGFMGGKLYIKTMGCQMNEYDSTRMVDLLAHTHGFTLTDKPEEADLLLLNTCSIRERAQEKVFTQLGYWKAHKRARPEVVIGVGGCVASQEGAAIRKRAPYVDLVFGPQTLHRLPEMLDTARATRRAVVDVSFPEIEKFDRLPEPRVEGVRAFVSIMEGCSKYCTYCVVPFTRGEEFSRPFDDVLAEVVSLAGQGVREVTLLGQNVNAYRGAKHGGGMADLADLIRYVAEIDGIDRIRFTTSHPVEFNDRLIEAYRDVPQLASHLHLPVQSGSDRILAAMKRGHTALEYKAKIRKLARRASGHQHHRRLHCRFSGRDRRRFRGDTEPVGRGRLR